MSITTLFIDDCFGRDDSDPRRQKINLLKAIDGIDVKELDAVNLFEFKQARKEGAGIFDLIFVDYKLSTGTGEIEGFSTGDQCESLVRAMCSDTPIYLLSVDVGEEKEFERPEGFERQVGETFLSNPQKVYQEVADHQTLSRALASGSLDMLLSVMACDDVFVKEDLSFAMPNRVRRCFKPTISERPSGTPLVHGTKGARVEFYRWFIDQFYRNTGFLADDHSAANLLGMTVGYFNQNIKDRLNAAKYTGIFSQSLRPRWWVGQIKNCLLDLDEHGVLQQKNFSEGCVVLLKVPDDARARCAACGGLWPERLGYVQDDAHRDLHPVHISCSISDPEVDLGPYFTCPRLIIDDESSSD